MRIVLHLYAVATLLLCSCTSHTAKNDADTVVPDGDVPTVDDAVEAEADDFIFTETDELLNDTDADTIETDTAETDAIDQENDPGSDADDSDAVYCVVDENPDADIIYIPNTHTGNELCPDLSLAEFPYYDTDGTIHFCRQCDEVRENDPQCVRNLWLDANEQLCTEMPQYECYDYPCDMPWLEPIYKDERYTGLHECDIALNGKNPVGWDPGHYTLKHFNISDGKIGFYMSNANTPPTSYYTNTKLFEYSTANRKYRARAAPVYSALAYHKGAYLIGLGNGGIDYMSYILYIDAKDEYRIAYNKKIRIMSYTPALTDNWAFANIQEYDGAENKLSYTKVGEWKWTSLGYGTANEPFIVGDRLVFYDDNFIGYYCDLDKNPQTLADCGKVNRDGEQIRFPVPDADDNRLIYFENIAYRDRIFRLNFRGAKPEYEEFQLEEIEPAGYMTSILQVKGPLLIYGNAFQLPENSTSETDSKLCYYRVDQRKSYCMKPIEHIFHDQKLSIKYNYSFAEFDDHYLAWQTWEFRNFLLRDMDCYCEKEGVCPFEGLK